MQAESLQQDRAVRASIHYFGDAPEKPTFHAKDHRRDNWRADVQEMAFHDARDWADQPTLEREGLMIASHKTRIKDFKDREEVRAKYPNELEELIREVTGASRVVGFPLANMRFSPRSPTYKDGANSQPAHFPHIDVTPKTAHGLVDSPFFGLAKEQLEPGQVLVGYNIWRVLSEPPQDMPLALCDSRSVLPDDLVAADGVYDAGDPPWPKAEAYLIRHNPDHRWIYFSNMKPDEALIFRAYGNEPVWRAGVPHVAFADPNCPDWAGPRVSVEARAYAVFDT